MSMFSDMLRGVVGSQMGTIVSGLIEQHGGVQGIVAQLEQSGLGGIAKSWVGTGANAPITAQQVHAAFDPAVLTQLAQKFGLHPNELAQKLTQALPQAIDRLTPNGTT